nr:helix-turn-helix domain-containing protein [uncultured Devosia sp.]
MEDLPTSAQIRAGRALIGWTQDKLAEAAGTSRRTIATLELGGHVSLDTMRALRTALETAGIEFLGDPGSEGVRLKATK